jgi:hypothetical protein
MSGFWRRNNIGPRVSWSTSLTSRSVISAKVKLADRCKSMFSEYTRVLNARRGSPEKKSVSARCERSVYRSYMTLAWAWGVYILEEAQQIGNGLPFAVS